MGNRNWMRAREALLDSDLIPGDLDRLFPICTPGASDSASFDEVLELLHMGGRTLPHAVLMMIPEAWENHQEMDPAAAGVLRVPLLADGAVGRPGLRRRSPTAPRSAPCSTATACARAATGSPTTASSSSPPRSESSTSTPPASSARAGSSRAGCSSSTPTSTGSSRTRRSRASSPPSIPYDEWLHAGLIHLDDIPEREHIVHTHSSVTRRQQVFGYTAGGAPGPADPDGELRGRADRLDGHRQPDRGAQRPPAAALRLLRADVRAGDQPAARRDPRGARHLAGRHDRPGGQPARADTGRVPPDRGAVPGPRQRRAGQDPPHQPRRRHARLHHPRQPRPLRGRGRRRRDGAPSRRDLRRGLRGHRRRSARDRALRPPLHRRAGADPVAAAHRRRPPPPGAREDPDPGRPDPRGRRRARGAPRRAPDRVRRGRGQPLPRDGVGRGPRPRRLLRAGRARGRRPAPDQGPRQGRAQGDVQDGHLHGRVLHRRPDLRGRRPLAGRGRPLLHRYDVQARRRRARHHRRGGRQAPRHGVPPRWHQPDPPRAAGRRRVPVAPRRRAAPVRPRDRLPAPALHAQPALRRLQAVHRPRRRAVRSG